LDTAFTFDDMILEPNYNDALSRKEADISVDMGPYKLKAGIISAPMDRISGWKTCRAMAEFGALGILHRFMSIEKNIEEYQLASKGDLLVGVSIGCKEQEMDRLFALYNAGARIVCVDTAHGHSKIVGRTIKRIRELYPDIYIIAGNVCTHAGSEYLTGVGANAIRVGIGPGSHCSTRLKTGFGIPQGTAIQECSRSNIFIIADGGIRYPCDYAKATLLGASAIMCGGFLSSAIECPGDIIDGYRKCRGMASKEFMEDFYGQVDDWKTSEGVETIVKVNGTIKDKLLDLTGGLKSALTYAGSYNISEFKSKTSYRLQTYNAFIEGTPHAIK